MKRNETTAKDIYISELFASETDLQKDIAEKARLDNKAINISAIEGKILEVLAASINASKIVEVGTLYGYSSSWLVRSLPEDGVIYSIERDAENFKVAESFLANAPYRKKVKFILGAAKEKLNELEKDGPFDLVFIDADKPSYPEYLDWAEKNVRKGGVIIGDNTFLFGGVYGEGEEGLKESTIKKMQEFNWRLSDEKKYRSIILPTVEGMTIAIKL